MTKTTKVADPNRETITEGPGVKGRLCGDCGSSDGDHEVATCPNCIPRALRDAATANRWSWIECQPKKPYITVIQLAVQAPSRWAPSINLKPIVFECRLPISLTKLYFQELPMSDKKDSARAYQPIPFAKKHRISVEDATAILKKHGADHKSADKEARRVAV